MGRDCDWSEQLRVKPLAVRALVVATPPTHGPDPVAVHQPRIVELVDRISAQTMEVEPLSLGDMRHLLLSCAALDDGVNDLAFRRAQGIPLIALQLVHAWASSGSLRMVDCRYAVKGGTKTMFLPRCSPVGRAVVSPT